MCVTVPKISVVVPCRNEETVLPMFYKELTRVADEMPYAEFEFVFIDDGSDDGTLKLLRKLSGLDKRVRFVSFSRKFGKEPGMLAGLRAAKGDYVAVMDADLQHPPSMLKEMYETVSGGYDCAAAKRVNRKGEPKIRSFFSGLFYKLISRISDTEFVEGACDFRLMRRTMADAVISLPEYNRFSKGIFSWVGFKTKWLPYENVERAAGKTKWSLSQLFLYSLEGIIAFSTAPLALASVLGAILCLVSFLFICFILARTALSGGPVESWPSMICAVFFLSGIQLFCTGILGQYLAKTYMETKRRPLYIIRETEEGIK